MKEEVFNTQCELDMLCKEIRELINKRDYKKSFNIIVSAMQIYPDAAQVHNLLGILYEKQDKHLLAMRHFRAALALEPSYVPAIQNLESFGTFFSKALIAFDESDCHVNDVEIAKKHGEHGTVSYFRRK